MNGHKKSNVIICGGVKIGKNDCVPGNRIDCRTCQHAKKAKVKATYNVSEEESRTLALNTSQYLNGGSFLND